MMPEAPKLSVRFPPRVPTHFSALFLTPGQAVGAGSDRQSPPTCPNTVSEPGTAGTAPRMPYQSSVCRQLRGDRIHPHQSVWPQPVPARAAHPVSWSPTCSSPHCHEEDGETPNTVAFLGYQMFSVVDRCCCLHLCQIFLENFTLKLLLNLEGQCAS